MNIHQCYRVSLPREFGYGHFSGIKPECDTEAECFVLAPSIDVVAKQFPHAIEILYVGIGFNCSDQEGEP